jgi:hypothetical protein
MKSNRIFGFTAAFLFVMFVTTGLWAQELKFDGYINSGLGIVTYDHDENNPFYKAFGVDSESNGYRFRLNGSYTNEAKNAGARFRLQGQRRLDQVGYLSMPYLYGWVGFFQNILTFTGGLVDDGTWTSADWWWNDDVGEGLGLLLKIEPVKGLIIGVGAYTISQQSGGSNNWLQVTDTKTTTTPAKTLDVKDSNGDVIGTTTIPAVDTTTTTNRLPNFNEIILKPEDAKYTFNIAYTLPDAFRFNAIFRTQNKAGWTAKRNDDEYDYNGREESMFFQAELRLLAVKNLTAVVVSTLDKLQENDRSGNIIFSETIGYKANNLGFGLNAVQFLYNRLDANAAYARIDMNPGLLFNPWISYTAGIVVPRIDLVYFMGGQSKLANGNNQWERRGFVNVARAKDADDDYSVFSVRPSIKFNLDSRAFFEIGDMINYDMATKDGAYKTSGDANKKSLFSNVFYVDLKFSF